MANLRTAKLRPIQYVPPFDYAGFPLEEIRPALLHMRDLGQALYDLRQIVDSGSAEVRRRVQPILDERSDFADDIVEIGLGHLEDEAGFLRHVHILGDLSPDQEARVA